MNTPIPESNDPHLKITPENGPMEGYRMEHPCFGHVQFNRWSGNTKDRLFMSNVESYSGMSIEINHAELVRHLGDDHIFTKSHIIRIDLTPAQFADLLTNMNSGGTPCTIRYNAAEPVELRSVPPMPQLETAMNKVEAEFDQALQDLEFIDQETALSIRESISKLPAKHQTAVVEAINGISAKVKSHLVFIRKQWEASAQKTVTQLKHEVSNYTLHMLKSAGVQAINDARVPTLPDDFGQRQTLGLKDVSSDDKKD